MYLVMGGGVPSNGGGKPGGILVVVWSGGCTLAGTAGSTPRAIRVAIIVFKVTGSNMFSGEC
jgi:hypothetical protein